MKKFLSSKYLKQDEGNEKRTMIQRTYYRILFETTSNKLTRGAKWCYLSKKRSGVVTKSHENIFRSH